MDVDAADATRNPPKPSQATIVDHERLSLTDGDIYLLSRSDASPKRTRYKVHKLVLATYSSVFQDTLELASGTKGDTIQADTPIPEIPLDDEAEVLTDLLSFMYPSQVSEDMPTFHNRTTKAVVALLYAADKYEIVNLRYMIEGGLIDQLDREATDSNETNDYLGSFSIEQCISFLAYGDRVANERIKELALLTSQRIQEDGKAPKLTELPDSVFDGLSQESLLRFLKHQIHGKEGRLQVAQLSFESLSKVLESNNAWRASCVKLPTPRTEHTYLPCWKASALPTWNSMILGVLRDDRPYPWALAGSIAQRLREANYGSCMECNEAIRVKIDSIALFREAR